MPAETRPPNWGTAWHPARAAGRNPQSVLVAAGPVPRDGPPIDVGDRAGAGDLVSCDTMLPRSRVGH
jgi:hypothetical protein